MWDYVPTRFLFCRTRGGARSVGFGQNGGDHVDPSPRDHQIQHVLKFSPKKSDQRAYLVTRGITRVVRSPSKGEHRVKLYVRQIVIKSSDGPPTLHRTVDVFREEPRLTRDRSPIVARSWPDHHRSLSQRQLWWKLSDLSSIAIHSESDRHAIQTGSPRDRGMIAARSWPRWMLIFRLIGLMASWN